MQRFTVARKFLSPQSRSRNHSHNCTFFIKNSNNNTIKQYATSSSSLQPGLYIIGTPIGNMRDMTLRGLDILHQADIVACEDPRHTLKLLNHYKIDLTGTTRKKKQILSYSEGKSDQMHLYRHSQSSLNKILDSLSMNASIVALCSDAGMPCVSDPGTLLVHQCYERGISVFVCPGASATVSAVALSGFPTTKFVFEGFLHTKKSKRLELFETVRSNRAFHGYSLVFFESPNRILNTIDECMSVLGPDYWCCICSELTKKFEKVWRGPLQQVRLQIEKSMGGVDGVRGEFTVVIAPNQPPPS